MFHQNNSKIYSCCVFLIFNCPNQYFLNDTERMLLDGMKEKWMSNHNDPKGERIDFIYVDPEDFDPLKYPSLDQNPKFSSLTKVNPYSHIYLIGHYYVEENRLDICDDNSKTGKKRGFNIDEITSLLLSCIKNKSVVRSRSDVFVDSLKNQKLMITVAICNTAIGIEIDGKRNSLNSFAGELAGKLFNSHERYYIDCVVSGIKGWVYPAPGTPSLMNTLRLITGNYNQQLSQNCHKRYTGAFILFNKVMPVHAPLPGSSKYKKYFTALPAASKNIENQKITIATFGSLTWKNSEYDRIASTNHSILSAIQCLNDISNEKNLPDKETLKKQIQTGELYSEDVTTFLNPPKFN